MTYPATISADYTFRPSELAATPALLIETRQPAISLRPFRLHQKPDRAAGCRLDLPPVRRRPGAVARVASMPAKALGASTPNALWRS